MAAILDDFQFDIFISYRHNDNVYDSWVTEFVERLKKELVATVKEKLTIFFDENPEDGLLESHQVDSTISDKIKALVFIPIVSQTYCDSKSFAWNNEFLLFSKAASEDRLGRETRLSNGNFASRILPVRIHEIDREDINMLEQVMQGSLRSIDFIYKSPGVNRPLRPVDDDLQDNLNNTIYRNQINKVANAIKEIIGGLKLKDAGIEGQAKPTPSEATTAPPPSPHWFNTTVPGDIKVAVLDREQPTVYLAWTSQDLQSKREEMAMILTRAGFSVIPNMDCPSSDADFKASVEKNLDKASCSLHILSGEFGRRFEEEDSVSFPMHQFEVAKAKSSPEGSKFHTFVWYLADTSKSEKPQQLEFINQIRNYITANMSFTNAFSPMQLVEDMRSMLFFEEKEELDTKDTDIFFIFNKQDAKDASNVTDKISQEYTVEEMNILPGSEEQYRELSAQQIPKSKMAVVYFRYGADWALPFIKQVWKEVGGASSPTTLMLVGEDDPETNLARTFKAPKIISTIVPKEEVPKEVKKNYDELNK